MLTEIGFANIIDEGIFVPPKILTQVYKSRARDSFIVNWRVKMANLTKCDMYQLYKTTFEREKYLAEFTPKLAIALCRYRSSNHKLEVEKGRYVRPPIPRMKRKYTKCNLNETGYEIHHLMICPKFIDLR